ncbi:hypothetical protein [Solimicrobium silvestre]|uniref:Uncharacterized protein n=1 Tax=Solimicrobium silvestre TaxID=2099400 RepID=A0A2S9H435_9BURK|nr:hypothetical protein [Solimicrobium silvestre]PRC94737.1 hypothetical protein S2091_0740 [Solimicrobium silvestre]
MQFKNNWYVLSSIVVLAIGTFDAQAQTNHSFLKTDSLMCDGWTVSIRSICSASVNGAVPHCTQKLTFKTAIGDDYSVNYEPDPVQHKDEPFVSQLSCNPGENKHYVVAHSGNFANCSTCEWIDVFTLHGDLIGSTPSIVRALKLPRKKLSRSFESLLGEPLKNELISIDRTYSEK